MHCEIRFRDEINLSGKAKCICIQRSPLYMLGLLHEIMIFVLFVFVFICVCLCLCLFVVVVVVFSP